jgi:TP53 regulating kinase-like protein
MGRLNPKSHQIPERLFLTYAFQRDVEIIRRGAEAEIRRGTWIGRRVIIKSRVVKRYRHPQLDSELRVSRTRNEARLIQEARKLGVPTPIIYDIDPLKAEIIMQEITGERVKDALAQSTEDETRVLCHEIGRLAATLHGGGMVHGDLTTSNMILMDGRIWLIDFSLGARRATLEEIGVDLHLLKEAFMSAHSDIFHMFQIVMDSYEEHFKNAKEVFRKVKEIENRGRYT